MVIQLFHLNMFDYTASTVLIGWFLSCFDMLLFIVGRLPSYMQFY